MRVAILTDNDLEKVNGVTTTLRAVLANAPADIEPHVYTLSNKGRCDTGYTALRSRGVPIPFHGEMRIYAPPYRELRRRLVADDIHLIHLTTPGAVGLMARELARDLALPLIGSYHTELGEYAARFSGSSAVGSLVQAYMRWLYGSCGRILVPSEATRIRLVESGWPAGALNVCGRGVDGERFSPSRRSLELRREWQVRDDQLAILYGGRVSREKGLALLPALRDLLREYRLPHRFVICGEGPMSAELARLVPEAVFTGRVAHEEMGRIMASADLFILPSDTDTAGNVVLEAQACGLPVLVTDRGGPREQMVDDVTGFVCQAGREQDFCWSIAQLIVDPRRRRRMSAAARAHVAGRSWPTALQPLFECYRETAAATLRATSTGIVDRHAHA